MAGALCGGVVASSGVHDGRLNRIFRSLGARRHCADHANRAHLGLHLRRRLAIYTRQQASRWRDDSSSCGVALIYIKTSALPIAARDGDGKLSTRARVIASCHGAVEARLSPVASSRRNAAEMPSILRFASHRAALSRSKRECRRARRCRFLRIIARSMASVMRRPSRRC